MKHNDDFFDTMRFMQKHATDVTLLILGILLGIFLDWTMVEVTIFAIFIWSILGSIPSRFLAVPALFFLVLTPVFLLIGRETRAEELAIYAYYFLVMAVIRGIIETRHDA